MVFNDKHNPEADARFKKLSKKYPQLQKTRFVGSWMQTIRRLCAKSKTDKFWVISSELNYDSFDFTWHPEPWQSSLTHVFPTKWQKWSDTFLVNKWEFEHHATWCTDIENLPKLNFVSDQIVDVPVTVTDIYVVDFGNVESEGVIQALSEKYSVVKKTRFFGSYLNTLRRLLDSVDKEFIWVVGTVCDYSKFDFSWQPEPWQKNMLHVFPSGDQKFGDTFYVNVGSLKESIDRLEKLDWFETVHYADDQVVPRFAPQSIVHNGDSIVGPIKRADFKGPILLVSSGSTVPATKLPAISLWDEKKRIATPLNKSGSTCLVPRDAISIIKTQVYDYPYVSKPVGVAEDYPLDVVFISNGESCAEENWSHLASVLSNRPNKVHRINNVNGRVAAYQAAANASETPWFFAVFAKLRVNENFDWSWQPDCLQESKHYIFHAINPVNGLVYGHQAMIAYNKELSLNNRGVGLDFTLDQAHEVIPVVSGVATYNTDEWTTWRTAFREVVKLKQLSEVSSDYSVTYRLTKWCDEGTGDYAELSVKGALDALAFYDRVKGNPEELKKSYEWDWLREVFTLQQQ